MSFQTWIRVEDDYAQFDHPKGQPLPKGAKKVTGYDEHVGPLARAPKRRTDKSGKSAPKTGAASDKKSDDQ